MPLASLTPSPGVYSIRCQTQGLARQGALLLHACSTLGGVQRCCCLRARDTPGPGPRFVRSVWLARSRRTHAWKSIAHMCSRSISVQCQAIKINGQQQDYVGAVAPTRTCLCWTIIGMWVCWRCVHRCWQWRCLSKHQAIDRWRRGRHLAHGLHDLQVACRWRHHRRPSRQTHRVASSMSLLQQDAFSSLKGQLAWARWSSAMSALCSNRAPAALCMCMLDLVLATTMSSRVVQANHSARTQANGAAPRDDNRCQSARRSHGAHTRSHLARTTDAQTSHDRAPSTRTWLV